MLHILVILCLAGKQPYIHKHSYSWVKTSGMNDCSLRAVMRRAWSMRQSNCDANEQGAENP